MRQYCVETKRLELLTSTYSMVNAMLDFLKRNRDFFSEWEDKKPYDYYTKDYQRYIVRCEQKIRQNDSGLDLWLFLRKEKKIIGKVTVFGILGGNASFCMIGYKLDKKYQHMGYMHEALDAVIEVLFNDFEMHRVEIYILPKNSKSIKVAERLGFEQEGTAKKYMRINGKWEDHIRYVKLNRDQKI